MNICAANWFQICPSNWVKVFFIQKFTVFSNQLGVTLKDLEKDDDFLTEEMFGSLIDDEPLIPSALSLAFNPHIEESSGHGHDKVSCFVLKLSGASHRLDGLFVVDGREERI